MALELGRIGPRVAGDQSSSEQRHKRDADDEGNRRRKRAGDAEGADQRGVGEEKRDEGSRRRGGGEHAGRSHDEHGIARRFDAAVAVDQPVAHGDGELHRIGEAEHHDQRDHDVQEQIELEAEPAEQPERPDDGDDGRQRGNEHQRQSPEEGVGDDRAEQEAEHIVLEAVALDGIPDLELHHRSARELHLEPGVLQLLGGGIVDLLHHRVQPLLRDDFAVESQQNECQRAVVGEELALDDLVVADLVDELLIGVALGQLGGKDGAGDLAGLRRLARGEQRDLAIHAVDELKIDDEVAQSVDRFPLEQIVAADHDQHVVFARREALGDGLVVVELRRVGAEQLGQRVIDPEPRIAEARGDGDGDDERRGNQGIAKCDQTEPLDAEA